MEKRVLFLSETDAVAVAEQMYGDHYVEDSMLVFKNGKGYDKAAINLAASLAGIDTKNLYADVRGGEDDLISSYPYCPLPINRDDWDRYECKDGEYLCYFSDLAAYNCGYLHGMWIDCAQDELDIEADIEYMLSWSPVRHFDYCEEWAIDDYDFGSSGIEIDRWENLGDLSTLANVLAEHGEPYVAFLSYNPYGSVEDFQEAYKGEYNSLADYAEETYEGNEALDCLKNSYSELYKNIDFEAIARDWELSGYIVTVEASVDTTKIESIFSRPIHVFSNY